ncbi:MAG: RsmB/NOP family class I SAM-dependent RNA methyltransferase [Planctomycetota bacterium]
MTLHSETRLNELAQTARAGVEPATAERFDRLFQSVDAQRAWASFACDKPAWLYLNPLRSPQEQQARSLQELSDAGIGLAQHAVVRGAYRTPPTDRAVLSRSGPVNDGRAYIQGLSSRVACDALRVEAADHVLDLCAAPGGKTLRLAAQAGDSGHVVAVEPTANRKHRLLANLRRCGADGVEVVGRDGRSVGRSHAQRFDKALVDAPCSGEARWAVRRADPQSDANPTEPLLAYRPGRSRRLAAIQTALLLSAIQATRPGGVVVYTTCTLAPEENESVVDRVLKRSPRPVQIDAIPLGHWPRARLAPRAEWNERRYHPSMRGAARLAPDPEHDAVFACRLRVG